MRVPDGGSIFNFVSDKAFVAELFDDRRAVTQISLQERECLIATSSYVVDVVVPRSVVDGDPQVFHRINFVKYMPFHGITKIYDVSLPCHCDNLAFIRVKRHAPVLLPV